MAPEGTGLGEWMGGSDQTWQVEALGSQLWTDWEGRTAKSEPAAESWTVNSLGVWFRAAVGASGDVPQSVLLVRTSAE